MKVIADTLCRRYHTRDPFGLAASLGVLVLYEPLGNLYGYYNKCYRQKFIHINQSLSATRARFACAHELGHAVLHPNLNTPFLEKNTLFSLQKLELEANHFAVDCLFHDDELQPFLTRSLLDAASYMNVPVYLAQYRMNSVQPSMWTLYE